MPDGYPTLSYLTPKERPPARVSVFLFLWSIFYFVAGVLFLFFSLRLFLFTTYAAHSGEIVVYALFFLCLGILLLPWCVITFIVARRILHGDLDALERAVVLNTIAEIAAWITWFLPLIICFLEFNGAAVVAGLVVLMILFPIPIAITFTSRYLRWTLGHFSPTSF